MTDGGMRHLTKKLEYNSLTKEKYVSSDGLKRNGRVMEDGCVFGFKNHKTIDMF
jgi:hypothetical protein